ncbi:MAG: hypothetical protein Q8O84_04995 [Nanoarchaeota archaeon]|nr:hypothetical protein [Nanoarchaeota archaeon]
MERLTKEMSKSEIEKEVSKWGEYVQIDNLTRFLKTNPGIPVDVKKFVNQKLGEVYEKRRMFFDSAISYEKVAELCVLQPEKIKNFLKAVNSYIKSGYFDRADESARKCLRESSSLERAEILKSLKEFYKQEAERGIKENKRSNTIKVYERMIEMATIPIAEKTEIKEKLLKLYLTLGMMPQYNKFKGRTFTPQRKEPEKEEDIEGLEFLYK